ncbi:hypothetical protein TrLO_g4521 [Triparma laevis f. longispina]|nr:hypothetical protein TrLO_g4521 [Triparma laevis f. longispina]
MMQRVRNSIASSLSSHTNPTPPSTTPSSSSSFTPVITGRTPRQVTTPTFAPLATNLNKPALEPSAPPIQEPTLTPTLTPLTQLEIYPSNSTLDSECPICYDPITSSNQIKCSNSHKICIPCMRQIVLDSVPSSSQSIPHVSSCSGKIEDCCCTGFGFRCPVCREDCVMGPGHVKACVKGTWDVKDSLPPIEVKPKSLPSPKLTNKGYTTTCVSCHKSNTLTTSVTSTGDLIGLCCSNGHTLCVACSRSLGDVTKCNSVKCKGVKCKQFGMGYECPECKVKHVIGRRHMGVLLRGGWKKNTGKI